MATAREILNELLDNGEEEKIVKAALENSEKNAAERIQGNKNDKQYQKDQQDINNDTQKKLLMLKLAKMKEEQQRNEAIKAAQGVKLDANASNAQQAQQGVNKVGSNNASSGVSAQVQKPV